MCAFFKYCRELGAIACLLIAAPLSCKSTNAGPYDQPECVIPAKSGGGFQVTCRLAQAMLGAVKPPAGSAMRLSHLPGGVGALAFNAFAGPRAADHNAVVAFSGGVLLNLAQGRYGPYDERDMRWLAVLGMDYGVIAVAESSPFHSLGDVVKTLQSRPNSVVFGAGGSTGSQDWFKVALLARAAGVSHKTARFVAFEGGGDALRALEGGHVDVLAGDAAELSQHLQHSSGIRVLAVLSEQRLPGRFASVPTAREQGFDIRFSTARGLYMGRKVSDSKARQWLAALEKARADPGFAVLRAELGLYPAWMTGAELDRYVADSVAHYKKLAAEFKPGSR